MLEITPVPELKPAREDVGPARHADCGADIVAIKYHAILREGIEVRGPDLRVSVTPHRIGALVISEQKDDVGPFPSTGKRRGREAGDAGQEHQQELHRVEDRRQDSRRSDPELAVSPAPPTIALRQRVLSLEAVRQLP